MGFVNVIFPRVIDKPPAIPYDSPKGGKRHGTSHAVFDGGPARLGKDHPGQGAGAGDGAIRFTPDEWHLFLFGDDFHDPQEHELHNQRHDKVEALMWQVGKRLLAQGVSVILDFGFWAKEQREEKFREAQALGAGFAICYVHAPLEELCRRLEHRVQAGRKDVFQAISREDMERWAALFQPPDAGELRGEYGPG